MTIQAGIEAELPYLRSEAEGQMTVTLAAYSPGSSTVVNGQEVPGFTSEGTTRGKIASRSTRGTVVPARTVLVGQVEVPVLHDALHLPITAPIPAQRWEYEVTAVGPVDDVALIGRRYRVVETPAHAHSTSRRLDVIEIPQ